MGQWLLAEQGGILDGALRGALNGAIIGGIMGALTWAGLQLYKRIQNRGAGKKDRDEPPDEPGGE